MFEHDWTFIESTRNGYRKVCDRPNCTAYAVQRRGGQVFYYQKGQVLDHPPPVCPFTLEMEAGAKNDRTTRQEG